MASIDVRGLAKSFDGVVALQPTDLTIEDGEFLVIVGPSGCGKSTLLRLLAGLETPSGGGVAFDEHDVTTLEPAQRNVAMVFQSYALYPHLSVRENIAFPLRMAKRPADEIRQRVEEVAGLLELTPLLDRRPRALSGGQRQRVSIGRAIVRNPAVLLLDEPLSNLDAALRVRMRHEFARLHQRLGTTMVYVTHDQLEAMTLANRIVVMSHGRIEQVGAPLELYARPATLRVAEVIGSPAMNFLSGVVVQGNAAGAAAVRLPSGDIVHVPIARASEMTGQPVTLGVRPEHLRPAADGPFAGTVELFERLGPLSFVHLGREGESVGLVAQLPNDRQVTLGEPLRFGVDPAQLLVFDADGRVLPPL